MPSGLYRFQHIAKTEKMILSYSTKLDYNYRLEDTIRWRAKFGYPGVEISGFIPVQSGCPTNLCATADSYKEWDCGVMNSILPRMAGHLRNRNAKTYKKPIIAFLI